MGTGLGFPKDHVCALSLVKWGEKNQGNLDKLGMCVCLLSCVRPFGKLALNLNDRGFKSTEISCTVFRKFEAPLQY